MYDVTKALQDAVWQRMRSGARGPLWALAVSGAALGLASCSSVPDWAKPSAIYGDSGVDNAPDAATEAAPFPQLADVPARPDVASTPGSRQDMAEGLIADREQAQQTVRASEQRLTTVVTLSGASHGWLRIRCPRLAR